VDKNQLPQGTPSDPDDDTSPITCKSDVGRMFTAANKRLVRASVDAVCHVLNMTHALIEHENNGNGLGPGARLALDASVMVGTAASLVASAHAMLLRDLPKVAHDFERTAVDGFVNSIENAAMGKCDEGAGLTYAMPVLKELHEKTGRAIARLERQSASN
jgi:hypothetical protein